MVLDRAAGYTMTEIAERWDYTSAQVANVMSHPDAQTILSTIAALQAEQLTDIEARFKALAPVALNVKTEILTNPEVNPGVRDRVASDILDRAGYAPRKHVEVDQNHRFFIPAQAATGLKEIMQESMRVSSMNFSKHLQRPDAEVAAEHLQVAEVGHLLPADGASPVPAPVSLESQERVA